MPLLPAVFGSHAWKLRALTCLGGLAAVALATPVLAAPDPSAKLVRCGTDDCLRISGRRTDEGSVVVINGHAVAVQGKQRWQVHLPIAVVRNWSPSFARTIEVSLSENGHGGATVDLPIGMLGSPVNLASLVVSVR